MREAVAEEERAHVEDENDFAMPVSESTPAVTREQRRGRRLRSHRSHRAARVRGGRRAGGRAGQGTFKKLLERRLNSFKCRGTWTELRANGPELPEIGPKRELLPSERELLSRP